MRSKPLSPILRYLTLRDHVNALDITHYVKWPASIKTILSISLLAEHVYNVSHPSTWLSLQIYTVSYSSLLLTFPASCHCVQMAVVLQGYSFVNHLKQHLELTSIWWGVPNFLHPAQDNRMSRQKNTCTNVDISYPWDQNWGGHIRYIMLFQLVLDSTYTTFSCDTWYNWSLLDS